MYIPPYSIFYLFVILSFYQLGVWIGHQYISVLLYLVLVQYWRHKRREWILTLDPVRDCFELVNVAGLIEFPFLNIKSLEFGLYRTYAIPSISGLLDKTGEFKDQACKRYNDTDLLIREFTENSLDSKRGTAAIKRLNTIHGWYNISNEDYLYVLSVFICEPVRWLKRYGFRNFHPNERQAAFAYWIEIGKRMGIKDLPQNYEECEKWNEEYEKKFMIYAESNVKIAESTTKLFLSVVPESIRGQARMVIYALCDERLRKAFGYPSPSSTLCTIVDLLLRFLGFFIRHCLLPRPMFFPDRRSPTKPTNSTCTFDITKQMFEPVYDVYGHFYDQYCISKLGPEHPPLKS